MPDNWDDSDDEWDVNDDEIDKKLGLKKPEDNAPKFDDEEDLALKEHAAKEKAQQVELKKKGTALAQKKQAEQDRLEELELAKKVMELEAEKEAKMTADELRLHKQNQIEEADSALAKDLFGSQGTSTGTGAGAGGVSQAGDKVVMKDLKDHLKHARKVSECMRGHGNIHYATAFFKELFEQSKDLMDNDSVTELVKILNVIKNDKVQAQKVKPKGQPQKVKKDKVAEAKARQIQIETFGDNDQYDAYDEIGENYEDAFF